MTKTVNATALNTVEQAIADFEKNYKNPALKDIEGFEAQIAELQTNSRDRTYDMVAGLVDLADLLNVETPTAEYEAFLTSRAIRKPAEGQNPYMALIKAVFAVKTESGVWVFGDEQRSYEKHANHVRFLVNARRKGLITGTVQNFIRNYDKKLSGIEAQDRLDNPNKAQQDRVKETRNKAYKMAVRAIIPETFSAKDGEWVMVYGRVREGQLELLHGEVVNDNQKDSVLYKLGSVKQ